LVGLPTSTGYVLSTFPSLVKREITKGATAAEIFNDEISS
jgi:hypothetical protein